MLVLTTSDVERLLPMGRCIEVMETALIGYEQGRMSQPLRTIFRPPGATGAMAWMPSHRSGDDAVYAMKLLCVVPGNPARGLDGHQGMVVLLDGETGEARAVMNASAITAIRTAAVSALATRLLARPDATELAVIGTGVQARTHLEAIGMVRPIRRARVAGRTPERARAFAAEVGPDMPFPVDAAASVREAVSGADIVVTATSARDPLLDLAWLEGAHVNAVGAGLPPNHELFPRSLPVAALYTDRRESLRAEATEYRIALEQELIGPEHCLGELGELLTGKVPGRTSPDQVTVFRSLGIAIEDLAAAAEVVRRARETGMGTSVDF
jgi:ornithine cyclodeaminase